MRYDVVVLGAGSGGYVAAIRAAQLGLSVAIVEANYWGGGCLNVGCIPSKALLRNAEIAHLLRTDADTFGIEGATTMRIKGQHIDTQINFDAVIIATGASPRLLPGTSRGPRVRTYEEQIMSRELPSSIAIIGAGPIGIEFAYVLANYGVAVTVIESPQRVLPNEDVDVSKEIAKAYRNLGITMLVGARIEGLTETADAVTVTYRGTGTPDADTLTIDVVLQAIGLAPNTNGYGLERLGVATDPRSGGIVINDVMETSVPGVYAVGDVTAKLMLAHVAEAQVIVAAETIAGTPTLGVTDYAMVPRVTFCQPQVATFGLTEAQARGCAAARGSDIAVAKFPFRANGKAHGYGDPTGFAKVIADRAHGELLGAHLVGADVAELLPELTLAQRLDLTVEELVRNVHTHPTLTEALQETFHGLAGKMINF